MVNTDRIFHGAALEIAQTIQEDDPDFVERADVRGGEVCILPEDDEVDSDALEAYAEAVADDYPFTVSEWWTDRTARETFLVLSSYWPTGGQCSDEQLDEYDEFVAERSEGAYL